MQTENCRLQTFLIVTFLTFGSTDPFYCNAVYLMILQVVMVLLVNAVKFIPGAVLLIIKVNLCFPVTVDTPAHA